MPISFHYSTWHNLSALAEFYQIFNCNITLSKSSVRKSLDVLKRI